jgi:hypothetical protein
MSLICKKTQYDLQQPIPIILFASAGYVRCSQHEVVENKSVNSETAGEWYEWCSGTLILDDIMKNAICSYETPVYNTSIILSREVK